jgi:hypothetical protein
MFSFKSTVKGIDNFFFDEKPTEGLAVFRIIWMGLIFSYFLLDIANVNDFYGPHALISLTTVKDQFPYLHANLFHMFRPGYEVVYLMLFVYGISLVASILGLFTRYSLAIALICMTSFHQRNIWLLSSSEVLMRVITLYLVFSPCGNTLSLDSLIGRVFPQFSKPRSAAVWALRLIQIQISVVYVWTVWHKLKGETWWDGSALYYASRLQSMTNFTLPFLMDSMIFLKLMTWGTLIIELSLGILVWFKEFRRPVIIGGIIFHFGIEYLMSIPFFELYMISLLLNFFTPEEFQNFVTRAKKILAVAIQGTSMEEAKKERLITVLRGSHETSR